MTEAKLKFTREEYAARLEETRRAMTVKGVDLLIVTDPSNMNWLTGYDGWSFYVHQCVVVPPVGEPIWFGRGQDGNGARLTAYLAPENIIGYPDHYVQSTERHPMDYLSAKLVDKGWGLHGRGRDANRGLIPARAEPLCPGHFASPPSRINLTCVKSALVAPCYAVPCTVKLILRPLWRGAVWRGC